MIGKKIMIEVKNADIKTAAIRKKNEENNKKSFNSEIRSQNTVKKKAQKMKAELGYYYTENPNNIRDFHIGSSQYFKRGLLVL
jgi:hypothetical protein